MGLYGSDKKAVQKEVHRQKKVLLGASLMFKKYAVQIVKKSTCTSENSTYGKPTWRHCSK